MQEAFATYQKRRKTYGPSEVRFGEVMSKLFPQGLACHGDDDFIRLGLFVQIVSKITRYANDFGNPHVDSVHDLGLYAFMLEGEDRRVLNRRTW